LQRINANSCPKCPIFNEEDSPSFSASDDDVAAKVAKAVEVTNKEIVAITSGGYACAFGAF